MLLESSNTNILFRNVETDIKKLEMLKIVGMGGWESGMLFYCKYSISFSYKKQLCICVNVYMHNCYEKVRGGVIEEVIVFFF